MSAFVLRLEDTAKAMVEDEPWEDDEIPDEFQGFFFCLAKRVFPFNLFVLPDPIMSTLMRDPVTWEGEVIYCLCLGFKLLFDQVRM